MSPKEKLWFKNESSILRELDHPNIVKLFEIYDDPSKYYLVQELCNGGELFDEIINRKRFNEKDAAYLMSQVLSAINYCHQKSVVHRDLKPENILIEEKGKSQL